VHCVVWESIRDQSDWYW